MLSFLCNINNTAALVFDLESIVTVIIIIFLMEKITQVWFYHVFGLKKLILSLSNNELKYF